MKCQKKEAITHICCKLKNSEFVNRHKISTGAFTRVRKLTFMLMFILILRKSVKSIQLILNEFVIETEKDFNITAGAFTKARKKLKHTAYIVPILSFLEKNLISEITITVIPIILRSGKPLFAELVQDIHLKLIENKSYSFGFVQNKY